MTDYGEMARVWATGEDEGPYLYVGGEVVDIEDARAAEALLDRILGRSEVTKLRKTLIGKFKVRVTTDHPLWDRKSPDRTEYYEAREKLSAVAEEVRDLLRKAAPDFIVDVEVEWED